MCRNDAQLAAGCVQPPLITNRLYVVLVVIFIFDWFIQMFIGSVSEKEDEQRGWRGRRKKKSALIAYNRSLLLASYLIADERELR